MKFCIDDEIKVNEKFIDSLFFNDFNLIEDLPCSKTQARKIIKRKTGKIIEYDFFKKKYCYVYLINFEKKLSLWFLESEITLI